MIELTCKQCGTVYRRTPKDALKSRFCSAPCRNRSQQLVLPPLTERQLEIITGCLLGDGFITREEKQGGNCCFQENHAAKYREYLLGLSQELNEWSGSLIDKFTRIRGKDYPCCKFSSRKHEYWTQLRQKWYPDGLKRVPQDTWLTPLTVAHWFCGDGTNNSKKGLCSIATDGFVVEDVKMLVKKLKEHLNIEASMSVWQGYPKLCIRSVSYLKFIEMISPHVVWDCFKYKLAVSEWGEKHRRNFTTWRFVDSIGNIYETNSLVKFAKEHGLNPGCLCSVAKGRRQIHKGWTMAVEFP